MSLKFCHKCGGKLEGDPDFCDFCGADLRERKALAKESVPSVEVAKVPAKAKKAEKKVAVSDQYADFFPRFLALLIDLGVIVGLLFVALIFLHRLGGIFFVTVVPLVSFLYFWLLEAFNKGQTVGKMALKLRTVDATTLNVANPVKYLLNNLLKFNPLIILDLLIGILANMGDPMKRIRIMENASNTVVVRLVKE